MGPTHALQGPQHRIRVLAQVRSPLQRPFMLTCTPQFDDVNAFNRTPNRRSDHKFWTKVKCETTTATTATATSATMTTTTSLPANQYPLGAFEVNAACPRGSCGNKACAGELQFAYLTAPDGKLI